MRLTKVETKGFKSFADKTTLSFDGGVVGVVGPNGSGKSNINDAIKWVLGEGSAKQLRGDSMDDIIFAGSKTEPAADRVEVSLTFDNSKGENDIPHKHFTISRILKRGGQSEYYINGEEARLKDIKDIAMESGISKSSLAIISQGTVQDIAQATPEQRRDIFEEAAGVSKYKARKEEALRKLERTTDALKTIDAVADELEKKLRPLKKQAEKASLFLEKQNTLKEIEVSLIVEQVTYYSAILARLSAELESVVDAKEEATNRVESIEAELKSKNKLKSSLDLEMSKLEEQDDDLGKQMERVNVRIANATQRRKAVLQSSSGANVQERIAAMQEELNELAPKIEQFKKYYASLTEDNEERKTLTRELQEQSYKMEGEIRFQQNALLKLKTRIAVLSEQRENKSHLHHGVKVVLDNKNHFKGVYDILANLLKVKDEYKVAIEAAASSALQNIVVSKSSEAVRAIEFLKANRAGRATFLPLDTINPKSIREDHYSIFQARQGFLGSADQLVETDARFEVAKRAIMGNVIVMDNIANAEALSKALKPQYTIVTLDGDIIRPGGAMTGGTRQGSNSFVDHDVEIQLLQKQIPKLEEDIKMLQTDKALIEVRIEEEKNILHEKSVEINTYREKIYGLENMFAMRKSEFEGLSNSTLEISTMDTENYNDSMLIVDLESQRSAVKMLRKAKRESSINLMMDIATLTDQKTNLEKLLREISDRSSEKLQQKSEAAYIIKSQSARLMEQYEMTVESAHKVAGKLDMDMDEASKIVVRIKQEMREIGNVNLDSIQEYETESKRYEKLDSSRVEIRNAYEAILNAISQMDQVIITKLDETVQLVNKEMQVIFKVMFGGGQSQIKYTNPQNLLETGIDVIAQPPGKTVKNLKLFSGGEKALVAISLLFAILKAKPLPLCILDEVEAALDDANVIRFANYLQELKASTQFIVVTHRVGTMARVDHLFGATMQKRGVTSFFAVELAKARELINEKSIPGGV